MEVRKVDYMALDKKQVEEIMKQITGESTSGKGDGAIYQSLVDTTKLNAHLDYFGFFRLLSKMCHLTMTMKKEANISKKMAVAQEEMTKIEIEALTQTTIGEHLEAAHNSLIEEAQRIRQTDVPTLRSKLDKVTAKLNAAEKDVASFLGDYFP